MRRSKIEEQKTELWSSKKKIQQSEKKVTALFKNFVKKDFNLKINQVKKYLEDKKIYIKLISKSGIFEG